MHLFFGPRAVWVAAAMLVLALAAIVVEPVTLSRRKQ
jgi:heme exporter protein D